MAAPAVALRYMTRFSCVGAACEETCCGGGWTIGVDDVHHKKLVKIMKRSEVQAKMKLVAPEERTRALHARLELKADGSCTFLQDDQLCSLYRRFGGDAPVPNTCAIFPRFVAKIGERVELAGTLACPETARLALLAEDAFAIEPYDVRRLPRDRASIEVKTGAGVYESCFDDIRLTFLDLVGKAELPLPLRLFLCAYLGERTHAHFHRGVERVDAERLATDLAFALSPAVAAKWQVVLGDVRTQGARAGRVVLAVLGERVGALPESSSLRRLVRAVMDGLAAAGAASQTGDLYTFDPEKMMAVHAARRDAWEAAQGARIAAALTNLARQFWMKEPYTDSPDLRVHAQKLILRMALVRFLLFSHPLLAGGPAADDAALVERAVVDVVHKLSRALDHDKNFGKGLDALLASLQLQTLAEAVFLIQV